MRGAFGESSIEGLLTSKKGLARPRITAGPAPRRGARKRYSYGQATAFATTSASILVSPVAVHHYVPAAGKVTYDGPRMHCLRRKRATHAALLFYRSQARL